MDEQVVGIPQQESFNPSGMTKVEFKVSAKGEVQISLHIYADEPGKAVNFAIQAFLDAERQLYQTGHRVAGMPPTNMTPAAFLDANRYLGDE